MDNIKDLFKKIYSAIDWIVELIASMCASIFLAHWEHKQDIRESQGLPRNDADENAKCNSTKIFKKIIWIVVFCFGLSSLWSIHTGLSSFALRLGKGAAMLICGQNVTPHIPTTPNMQIQLPVENPSYNETPVENPSYNEAPEEDTIVIESPVDIVWVTEPIEESPVEESPIDPYYEDPYLYVEPEVLNCYEDLLHNMKSWSNKYVTYYDASFTVQPIEGSNSINQPVDLDVSIYMVTNGNSTQGDIRIAANYNYKNAVEYKFFQTTQNWLVYTCIQKDDVWYYMVNQTDHVGFDLSALLRVFAPSMGGYIDESERIMDYESNIINSDIFVPHQAQVLLDIRDDWTLEYLFINLKDFDFEAQADKNVRKADKTLNMLQEAGLQLSPEWDFAITTDQFGIADPYIDAYMQERMEKADDFNFIAEDVIAMILAAEPRD